MTRVIVNVDASKHRIPREIYGQFAEHLGNGIYDGVYVGEESHIPNLRGMRKDVVQALKQIQVPIIRWPGGCFADEYHWRDGIGTKADRRSIVNSNWGGVVEDNSFGTHEFFDLCKQVGAEPYINGNVGSGTVQEMQEWIEYITCDNPASAMAELRRINGQAEAWKLKWFGIGNENWGCGGNMCPDYYAQLFKRYQTFVRNYGDNKIECIAAGPNIDDYHWLESLLKHAGNHMDHITLHYYSFDGTWEDKGRATEFTKDDYYHLLSNAYRMDDLISHHLSIMDRYDPEKRIGLIVDEWGTWHKVEDGTHPGFLFQQNTMRDALVASISLDIFNLHADRISMANIAQMVNVLQAMILTQDEQMVLTPTYHVFDLYKDHMDAMLLDSWHTAPDIQGQITLRDGNEKNIHLPSLSLTASVKEDNSLTITMSNYLYRETHEVDLELFSEAQDLTSYEPNAEILFAPDIRAYNSFDEPNRVTIQPHEVQEIGESQYRMTLPPGSTLKLRFTK